MSQSSISLANTSGSLFRANLNNALAAISSVQSGSSRPSGLSAPFLWLNTNYPSSTTWTLYLCDGTDDIAIATVDTTANTAAQAIANGSITNAMLAAGVGSLANNLVALNSLAQLPAVSGALLTNVDALKLGGKVVGTVATNILALDASGKIPAVDGSQLANVDAVSLGGKVIGTGANNIVTYDSTGAIPGATALNRGTAASASGLSTIPFLSIPSTAKRITLAMSAVSLSGTDNMTLQLGTGTSTFQTSGYTGGVALGGSSGGVITNAAYFQLTSPASASAAMTCSGILTLINISGNTWVLSGQMTRYDASAAVVTAFSCNGQVTLSGALTCVRAAATGSNTYDAGTINAFWE